MKDKLSLYLNVVNGYEPVVIPGKNKFTFLSKKTGMPQAYSWNGNDGNVQPFGDFKDRIMSVFHSPSGSRTIMGMDYKGNEKQQFYLVNEDGNYEQLVLSPDHFHNFGGWSSDESKVMYSSNRRNSGCFDVFVLDLATRKEEVMFEFDGNCIPICWMNDDHKNIVISIQETNIDSSLYILNIETKKMKKIGPEKGFARYQSVVFSKDGRTGYVLSDFEMDNLAVYRFFIDKPEKLEKLFNEPMWDVEEISLSPNEETLIVNMNTGGTSIIKNYNLLTNDVNQLEDVPSGVIDSVSWLSDNRFIFSLKSATMPGDIWAYDIQKGKAERLTYFGVSEEIEHLWTQPEVCKFKSFDELEVPYFYYSKEQNPKATVIYIHGGPESQIRASFNPVIQYLISKGFAVVAPNVRGSMGYGRKYVQLDDGRKRMDAVADLASLVEDLVQTKSIDRNKIGIMGRSYGGFMVLAAVTHYPNLWAAGVNIVGISHFKTFLENTGSWRRKLRECEYGTLGVDDDFFEEIAPLNHLASIQAPLLVFHGQNDTRVPVSEAEQLTKEMREMKKDVELFIFEDEGHQTEKLANHITMNTKIVEFFNKTLK
ncbi:S9 family peptidase [Sporosarcina limicola]|uniref:Dipeptidyl aminopeptidase/acylaminoacyl peptidase n=1 Tax=Sporosarcina limicola TaxID=34101 RepID=A0A927R4U1_9BACL|nr:S9 family peptidase [Sporosarcina limicola]MBE1556591.1 dipeptidyl aminopeptidase/acylaminoacyl peptidase [Sporosarcina limicola]